MVVIRLARAGAKKSPFYHMVVTDKRSRRDGRYIERVGYFNPVARGQDIKVHIDLAKIDSWVNNGAQLSDRVSYLLKEFKKAPVVVPTASKKPKAEAAPSKVSE